METRTDIETIMKLAKLDHVRAMLADRGIWELPFPGGKVYAVLGHHTRNLYHLAHLTGDVVYMLEELDLDVLRRISRALEEAVELDEFSLPMLPSAAAL